MSKRYFKVVFGLPMVTDVTKQLERGDWLIDEAGNVYLIKTKDKRLVSSLHFHRSFFFNSTAQYQSNMADVYGDKSAHPWDGGILFLKERRNMRLLRALIDNHRGASRRQRIERWQTKE